MDVLRGRLAAFEGGYHKSSQEDSLREYRKRRIREGAISHVAEELGAGDSPPSSLDLLDSVSPDKLAEVHAQETRLSAPAEVLRRRAAGQMPPDSGGSRPRRSSAFVAGALGAGSGYSARTSLGRARWQVPTSLDGPPLLAEETAALAAKREVAEKAMRAGTRALAYGSVASVVVLMLSTRLALHWAGVTSEAELRDAVKGFAAPRVDALRARTRDAVAK